MGVVAVFNPNANSFVEYEDLLGIGNFLLNKKNLMIYPVSNPLYSSSDKILWSLAYPVYDRYVAASKLGVATDSIPTPSLLDPTRLVGRAFMKYVDSDSNTNYYGFYSTNSFIFYKENPIGVLSKITSVSFSSDYPIGIFDVIDGKTFLVTGISSNVLLGYKVDVESGTLTKVLATDSSNTFTPLPHINYILYVGYVDGGHYFVSVAKPDGETTYKLVLFRADTSGFSVIGSYSLPDFDATVLPISIASLKREDGSYYVIGYCPNGTELTPFMYILDTSGNFTSVEITGSIDISSIDLPYSNYYAWTFSYYDSSNKYFLLTIAPDIDVGDDLLSTLNNIPVWLVYLDETNQQLVVKDFKQLKIRERFWGILPIKQDNSVFYVMQSYSLSKLKISNETILLAESFLDKKYLAIGIDLNGRLWGLGDTFAEILPEYNIDGYVSWEWSDENLVYNGSSVDNSIILNVYDENGNRISKTVNLAILTGNALFSDNNSYTITVTTSDTDDTIVNVTINDGGLVYINASLE